MLTEPQRKIYDELLKRKVVRLTGKAIHSVKALERLGILEYKVDTEKVQRALPRSLNYRTTAPTSRIAENIRIVIVTRKVIIARLIQQKC